MKGECDTRKPQSKKKNKTETPNWQLHPLDQKYMSVQCTCCIREETMYRKKQALQRAEIGPGAPCDEARQLVQNGIN